MNQSREWIMTDVMLVPIRQHGNRAEISSPEWSEVESFRTRMLAGTHHAERGAVLSALGGRAGIAASVEWQRTIRGSLTAGESIRKFGIRPTSRCVWCRTN